jgi:RNA polymerase sigma-70 factor (ECF subfamily)
MTPSTTGMHLLPQEGGRPEETRRQHLADLLTRAAAGDTAAFMRFYDLTSPTAYRVARALTADAPAAEALVCSLYLRAWTHASEHGSSGLSPLAWLLAGASEPGLVETCGPSQLPPHLWARGA